MEEMSEIRVWLSFFWTSMKSRICWSAAAGAHHSFLTTPNFSMLLLNLKEVKKEKVESPGTVNFRNAVQKNFDLSEQISSFSVIV